MNARSTRRNRAGSGAQGRPTSATLGVSELLADTGVEIVICCGSGGVGKTTTSAALALHAAEQGRRVVVLTIDPARRLAQSLGLTELDNTPREVAGVDTSAGGHLDAMMLDMKRTFDEVVLAHATGEKAAAILENPFYQALSSSFAGTQEYMAMEKLGQLHAQAQKDGRWDLIVVDTPPSRSALDFLEAPEHLGRLLDGRMLKMLLAPARGPFKLMSAGVNLVMGAMDKILGAQVLRDVQTFISAFDTLFGGFRRRSEETLQNLRGAHTRFLVVATPSREALREASYFTERLATEDMPLAGLVVNRVHETIASLSPERCAELLDGLGPDQQRERAALQQHLVLVRQITAEQDKIAEFRAENPGVRLAQVPAQASDVNDLTALRRLGAVLAAQ